MIMSVESLSFSRRSLLVTSAAAGASGLVLLDSPSYAQANSTADAQAAGTVPLAKLAQISGTSTTGAKPSTATHGQAIRPFSINFPEEALIDLRRRINTTVWPEQE